MRLQHFEQLRPQCPACKLAGGVHPLELVHIWREESRHIIEAVLHCSNSACRREFPVIDGIPVIVPDVRTYLSENQLQVFQRTDFSAELESLIGDCCGGDSAYNATRQHLSSYVWDHYGDQDPLETAATPQPGALLKVVAKGIAQLSSKTDAPFVLDAGCSVGRSSFALAEQLDAPVLGIDMHFAMLRVASEALRRGRISYPRRRVGMVFDRREFPVALPFADHVDFWACDALALPFAASRFSTACCLNLLDCVQSPIQLLASLIEMLPSGGEIVLASPYDWATSATPTENWLGGHSQRSPEQGSSEAVLRRLLDPNDEVFQGLQLRHEEDCDWQVRMHDRSFVNYRTHLVVAVKP